MERIRVKKRKILRLNEKKRDKAKEVSRKGKTKRVKKEEIYIVAEIRNDGKDLKIRNGREEESLELRLGKKQRKKKG